MVARDGIEPPTPAFQGCMLNHLQTGFLWLHRVTGVLIWTPFGLQRHP